MFLLCTQFSFYLFFFFHLNLFRPVLFKFFPTSQHDRTTRSLLDSMLGRAIFHSFVLPISPHLKLLAPFASLSYEYLTLSPVEMT